MTEKSSSNNGNSALNNSNIMKKRMQPNKTTSFTQPTHTNTMNSIL